ncbi:MAG: two-component system response regulator, partial [Kiritimatiellae bacterium]|nr:two-component system response regulator [Kiritimatiellia bacterium]
PPAEKLSDVIRAHVRRVLALHDGNIAATARALGVSRSTVRSHAT